MSMPRRLGFTTSLIAKKGSRTIDLSVMLKSTSDAVLRVEMEAKVVTDLDKRKCSN